MQPVKTLALLGASSLCLMLALSGPALAQTSGPQESTPAEQAQTQQLNQNITDTNAAAKAKSDQDNAQYQLQLQQYQQELQQYRARVRNYEEKSAHYEAARDRYIAAHARYHRYGWPSRYEHRAIASAHDLLGASVRTYNGRTVGHVQEVAWSSSSGQIDALRVSLSRGGHDVWIEAADLRFDTENRVVVTDLSRQDLYDMSHENY